MSGFSADWLALREPADSRARDANLTALFARAARRHSPAHLIDLACGTGANLRYLAPRLGGGEQDWMLVDSDAALLAKVSHSIADCAVKTRRLDLATELHAIDFTPESVVTASALLDLVSERWLAELTDRCRAARCSALFVLSYDGRITLAPTDVDDEWIRQLVNRHQLSDKGFGAALGPGAWQRTTELFGAAGYQMMTAPSDWNLLPHEQPLQRSLLEGWAAAAAELAPEQSERCREWLMRRYAHVASGASFITVGHQDVLAIPRD